MNKPPYTEYIKKQTHSKIDFWVGYFMGVATVSALFLCLVFILK